MLHLTQTLNIIGKQYKRYNPNGVNYTLARDTNNCTMYFLHKLPCNSRSSIKHENTLKLLIKINTAGKYFYNILPFVIRRINQNNHSLLL